MVSAGHTELLTLIRLIAAFFVVLVAVAVVVTEASFLVYFSHCRFLETEHLQHCVPSNVSSGLATLPLSYVYINGTKTTKKTTKKLPTGERLNGKRAYESIMPYFTTITKTPDQVHQLGKDMLNKLYPEVCLFVCLQSNTQSLFKL